MRKRTFGQDPLPNTSIRCCLYDARGRIAAGVELCMRRWAFTTFGDDYIHDDLTYLTRLRLVEYLARYECTTNDSRIARVTGELIDRHGLPNSRPTFAHLLDCVTACGYFDVDALGNVQFAYPNSFKVTLQIGGGPEKVEPVVPFGEAFVLLCNGAQRDMGL